MSQIFPSIDEKNLKLMMQLYKAKPDYFDDLECPYSEDIIKLFKGEADFQYFDSHSSGKNVLTDTETLAEISQIYKSLQSYGEEVKHSEKSSDKNTFFRVSVSLLEKITTMREKMSNIKEANTFISEMLAIMDDILDADQRNEVKERLKKFDTEDKL